MNATSRIGVQKPRTLSPFNGIVNEKAPKQEVKRSSHFHGYSDENAIQTEFQRVPPLPDRSVLGFDDIGDETAHWTSKAAFMYLRTVIHM